MKVIHGMCVLLLTAGLSGCGSKSSPTPAPGPNQPAEAAGHSHGKGPHGGVVFDVGAAHTEITVDHPKKEVTLLFLEGDEKKGYTPKAIACKELTMNTKETKTNKDQKPIAAMQIKLLPQDEKDGKASKFVGTGPGLGPDEVELSGIVLGEIDGKPAQGEFKE